MLKTLAISKFEKVNKQHFIIEIDDKELASQTKPGQFYQIGLVNTDRLKKPISVYNVVGSKISFLIKIVGEGTKILSRLKTDEEITVNGPLGNCFEVEENKNYLFVTGGIGYAPLKYLKQAAKNSFWIHGGQCADDIFQADSIFTNDGSVGTKGFVTVGLEQKLKQGSFDEVIACGPEPMLEAVKKLCIQYNCKLVVSLEAYMACGIGACKGCVVQIIENDQKVYKTVCKDGPIFDGYKVVF